MFHSLYEGEFEAYKAASSRPVGLYKPAFESEIGVHSNMQHQLGLLGDRKFSIFNLSLKHYIFKILQMKSSSFHLLPILVSCVCIIVGLYIQYISSLIHYLYAVSMYRPTCN